MNTTTADKALHIIRDETFAIAGPKNPSLEADFVISELVAGLKKALALRLCPFVRYAIPQAEAANLTIFLENTQTNGAPTAYFRIRIFPKSRQIHILGVDDTALRDGVFYFLERWVGIQWFFPGRKGAYIPQLPHLHLEACDFSAPLPLPYRGFHICGVKNHYDPDVVAWFARQGATYKLTHHDEVDFVGNALTRCSIIPDTTTHASAFFIPDEPYAATNPTLFALVGGRRLCHAAGGQLCHSNPETVELFARRLIDWAQAHPKIKIIGMPPNDGLGWCECPQCRAADRQVSNNPADVSGQVWSFCRQVAEKVRQALPDRWLGHYPRFCI